MLEFPLNVEGDHSRTSGALSLHQFMLGVRGKAYVGKENMEQSGGEDDDVSQVHIFWFTAV